MTSTELPLDVRLMAVVTNALVGLFVVLGLGMLGAWVVRHPAWSVEGISVQGDVAHQNVVSLRAQLATQMRSSLASSFLTVDLQQVRRLFESVPWVCQAVVQRDFPNHLRVTLQEHQAVAWWGRPGSGKLVNQLGEVFEANPDDNDGLPELVGPDQQSARVWSLFQAMKTDLSRLELGLQRLELDERGSWSAGLDNGAQIELGRGTDEELLARTRRFTATISQLTERYAGAVQSVDLRYPNGYALRMRGVTTVIEDAAKPKPNTR